jgi:hypothetical protein
MTAAAASAYKGASSPKIASFQLERDCITESSFKDTAAGWPQQLFRTRACWLLRF